MNSKIAQACFKDDIMIWVVIAGGLISQKLATVDTRVLSLETTISDNNTGSNVAPRAMPFWGVAKTSGMGIWR